MGDRRRNSAVLLLVALLLAISAVLIATKPTRLGLDLKGGVSLVYKGVPTAQAKVTSESLNRAINIMRKRVDQIGVSDPQIQLYGANEINVALPDVSNVKRAEEQVGKTAQLHFYDWEPNVIGPEGTPAPSSRAATCGAEAAAVRCGVIEYQAIQRAAKRPPILRSNGTTYAPGCTPAQVNGCIYGEWFLVDTKHEKVLCASGKPICAPVNTRSALFADNYRPPAGAKVKAVHINPGTVIAQAHPEEISNKIVNPDPNSFYVLNDNPVLSGEDINNPQQGFQNEGAGSGLPDVTFGFSSHGRKVFERVTKEIADRGVNAQLPGVSKAGAVQHFAIVLDEQVITSPSIDYTQYPNGIDATNGSQITGGFTLTSAQNLADELQSGALPIKLELISQSQVSATLGKQALRQGLVAGLLGLAVVCVFLLTFYRVLGLIAVGGLAIYSIYYFALIKAIPITMTLPGIAGLILTIGIAADANIVIFERVKEEIRSGRSIPAGIAAGYKRGFAAIVDANVVTFMTAFILFALATAEVQGFAFTLGLGTLLSLFTAVLATQAALGAMGRSRLIGHPALLGAARARRRALRFDFMGASRWFFSLSGTILLIGALAIGGKGLNLGIDFKSGTRIQTGFVRPVSETQIRSALDARGLHDAQIQRLSGDKSVGGSGYQISLKRLTPIQVTGVEEALGRVSPLRDTSNTSIGPTFGKTVANAAVIAIIASLLVISAYIALRFQWKYSVPVLIALMHDLLITAGVYSLTGREVTTATVAALLTILGYSLYDTIIVFDRVRENVPRMPRAAFSQIVNRSMSEVLTRSLATSFCTLLPVLALLLFGGETLKDFAFALMVGIASGAYSSIFIASPVLTHWKERESSYRNRRARLIRDLGGVPAYATALDGTPMDVEPAKRPRRRSGGLLVAEEPGEQVSREEFEEMVRDLDIEQTTDGRPARAPGRPGGVGTMPAKPRAKAEAEPPRPAAAAQEPAADLDPEDVVLKDKPKRERRARNRRHGRSR